MLKKHLGLSLVAVSFLVVGANAGKIITDANVSDIVVTPNQQFGFGGWNFDNVDVRIVNVDDFSGNVGTFDTDEGNYTEMGADMSFESDIINEDDEVVGHLHGKDWPVGEPAGIKIINGDENVKHGKPVNCIMTSSYQAEGYLDVSEPKPVICSSPWQTHKRYKINLLPSTVANVNIYAPDGYRYGKQVDLVFNLDPTDTNTTIRRYQVLQKANNYTGMRLDGYKVEVLDENGDTNPALTLSLGEDEGDEGLDIWGSEDMANMSHGLWGPYEEDRFANGFFDSARAYYPVTLSEDNLTISYVGVMDGGNYQEIFGNWLPSIWEPMGIFHDDDQDPETDGMLMAFFGVAPEKTELAWWKSSVDTTDENKPVYTWSKATEQDFKDWSGEWYEEGAVEDVLNLGLNYIINVGENAKIGSTFILRITPHVDSNQTAPAYVCRDDQHHEQGTLFCIDNTEPDFTPPYLPDDDKRHIQGTPDEDENATEKPLDLDLPFSDSCEEGERPEQGTDTCITK